MCINIKKIQDKTYKSKCKTKVKMSFRIVNIEDCRNKKLSHFWTTDNRKL